MESDMFERKPVTMEQSALVEAIHRLCDILAVSSVGKTSDSKSENVSSILSAAASESTELERAAEEYFQSVLPRQKNFPIESCTVHECFQAGAKWLAERLNAEVKSWWNIKGSELAERLEQLTKTRE